MEHRLAQHKVSVCCTSLPACGNLPSGVPLAKRLINSNRLPNILSDTDVPPCPFLPSCLYPSGVRLLHFWFVPITLHVPPIDVVWHNKVSDCLMLCAVPVSQTTKFQKVIMPFVVSLADLTNCWVANCTQHVTTSEADCPSDSPKIAAFCVNQNFTNVSRRARRPSLPWAT